MTCRDRNIDNTSAKRYLMIWRAKAAVAGAVLLAVGLFASARADDGRQIAIQICLQEPKMTVTVSGDFPKAAADRGLGESSFRNLLESRLRAAGLYFGDAYRVGVPALEVAVRLPGPFRSSGPVQYSILVRYQRWLFDCGWPSGFRPMTFTVPVWSRSFHGNDHPAGILESVRGALDEFMVIYLKVGEHEYCKAFRSQDRELYLRRLACGTDVLLPN